jgi:hypothetical protein
VPPGSEHRGPVAIAGLSEMHIYQDTAKPAVRWCRLGAGPGETTTEVFRQFDQCLDI